MDRGWRWSVRVAAVVGLFAVATYAAASGGGDLAKGIDELERDTAHKAVVGEPVGKAKAAMERARRFRASGDEARARLADGLAATWLDAAREGVRAADAEARAEALALRASDAGKQVDRERALVEEAMMQNGRLRAQLDQLEREAKGSADAGAPKVDGGSGR